jgi:hypothetical protein
VLFSRNKAKMVTPTEALSGWEQPALAVPDWHAVLGTPLKPPFPEDLSTAVLGLGCFWGASVSLTDRWRLHDGGRLRGRLHTEPHLRGGLRRTYRAHRVRARRL